MLNVKVIALSELIPYEKNPRNNKPAIDKVAESIKQFGFKVPIVIDKNNIIVCGHTRYYAAQKLNFDRVPCVIADDLTDKQIKAYRLADNKVSEFSEWDFDLLNEELAALDDFDMTAFGFEEFVEDTFGTDFSLPDGDKDEFEQITFTLHNQQAEFIRFALAKVKDDVNETFGNNNVNGNSLYEVVKQWDELKTLSLK